jgi:hypothetical protein
LDGFEYETIEYKPRGPIFRGIGARSEILQRGVRYAMLRTS